MMKLRDFVEKTPDADLSRQMVDPRGRRFAAERLMELEVVAAADTGYGEKDLTWLARRSVCHRQSTRTLPHHSITALVGTPPD